MEIWSQLLSAPFPRSFPADPITLSLKRNAPRLYWLSLEPRVKVRSPRQGHILSWEFETVHKKKTFKNVNRFSRYLEKSKGMSCFGICKTAQIPLGVMQIWYLVFGIFSKRCISFAQECMALNPGVIFNSAVFQVMLKYSTKFILSTLLRKRNATFHGAFLLRLSVVDNWWKACDTSPSQDELCLILSFALFRWTTIDAAFVMAQGISTEF